MRKSKVLAKLRAGEAARIAWLTHYVPPTIAYAATSGYDAVWLDLEHNPMDTREVQALLAFYHRFDIDCVMRPPTREKTRLYRFLEDGVTGFVVSHVSSPDEAREIVNKVKFPPVGDRGITTSGLENNYGVDGIDVDTFVQHTLDEEFLFVQIETPQGLAHLDEIVGTPGIDGVYIGPGDMGLRLKQLPPEEQLSMDEVMQRVAAACAKHNKHWGYYGRTVDDLRRQYELGARMLVWGVDAWIMKAGLKQAQRELDAVLS
ncbi:MAG: 4-hydroxy-2-oxovalerate aldolase [Chloroflexi bacterium]|nr:MAG: 4-hydroxy-2-oxovalerate aldolase [Chloroflexota bacterium]